MAMTFSHNPNDQFDDGGLPSSKHVSPNDSFSRKATCFYFRRLCITHLILRVQRVGTLEDDPLNKGTLCPPYVVPHPGGWNNIRGTSFLFSSTLSTPLLYSVSHPRTLIKLVEKAPNPRTLIIPRSGAKLAPLQIKTGTRDDL